MEASTPTQWYVQSSNLKTHQLEVAQILFGWPLQDNLPMVLSEGSKQLNNICELGMAKLKVDRKKTYDKGKHNLEPLKNGDKVIIQIMTGPHPTRWMRKGTMIKNS